jgi:hypothetical protein
VGVELTIESYMIIRLDDMLKLLEPAHLDAVQRLASLYYLGDNFDTGTIYRSQSIQRAILALWDCFAEIIREQDGRWFCPSTHGHRAQFISDIGELILPWEIAYVGDPTGSRLRALKPRLEPYWYVAFDICDENPEACNYFCRIFGRHVEPTIVASMSF